MANQHVNEVIYNGETLISLLTDTVTPSTLLKNVTAHDKSGAIITGTCTYDADTKNATAGAGEILLSKTAYVNGSSVTGTMPNNGAYNATISTKSETKTIPTGFHNGSGKISISSTEQAKIIPTNIRQGVEILGVVGSMSGEEGVNSQTKTVTPTAAGFTVTPDDGYNYLSQVNVSAIPYSETDNAQGGKTVTIL